MSGDLKERIEVMLAGLGDTADAVAEYLHGLHITGVRSDGGSCPIANLICREFPDAASGGWDDEDGYWYVTRGYIRTPDGDIAPPASVSEFIEVFDDGTEATEDAPAERPYWFLEDNR